VSAPATRGKRTVVTASTFGRRIARHSSGRLALFVHLRTKAALCVAGWHIDQGSVNATKATNVHSLKPAVHCLVQASMESSCCTLRHPPRYDTRPSDCSTDHEASLCVQGLCQSNGRPLVQRIGRVTKKSCSEGRQPSPKRERSMPAARRILRRFRTPAVETNKTQKLEGLTKMRIVIL
jgi:hypothetical protein